EPEMATVAFLGFLGIAVLHGFWSEWANSGGYGQRFLIDALPSLGLGFAAILTARPARLWKTTAALTTAFGYLLFFAAVTLPLPPSPPPPLRPGRRPPPTPAPPSPPPPAPRSSGGGRGAPPPRGGAPVPPPPRHEQRGPPRQMAPGDADVQNPHPGDPRLRA